MKSRFFSIEHAGKESLLRRMQGHTIAEKCACSLLLLTENLHKDLLLPKLLCCDRATALPLGKHPFQSRVRACLAVFFRISPNRAFKDHLRGWRRPSLTVPHDLTLVTAMLRTKAFPGKAISCSRLPHRDDGPQMHTTSQLPDT